MFGFACKVTELSSRCVSKIEGALDNPNFFCNRNAGFHVRFFPFRMDIPLEKVSKVCPMSKSQMTDFAHCDLGTLLWLQPCS